MTAGFQIESIEIPGNSRVTASPRRSRTNRKYVMSFFLRRVSAFDFIMLKPKMVCYCWEVSVIDQLLLGVTRCTRNVLCSVGYAVFQHVSVPIGVIFETRL